MQSSMLATSWQVGRFWTLGRTHLILTECISNCGWQSLYTSDICAPVDHTLSIAYETSIPLFAIIVDLRQWSSQQISNKSIKAHTIS